MKRFFTGLFTGLLAGLLLATTTFALAGQPIRLIVNGKEIQCDVLPQLINGRVLVPARFVAEPLGAKVEWDGTNMVVSITGVSPQENEINHENLTYTSNYYTARQILVSIKRKYPDMEYVSRDNIEIKQGEFHFDNRTGELWFNGQKFTLPKKSPDSLLYFSISPLIEANILTPSDIQPLQ